MRELPSARVGELKRDEEERKGEDGKEGTSAPRRRGYKGRLVYLPNLPIFFKKKGLEKQMVDRTG